MKKEIIYLITAAVTLLSAFACITIYEQDESGHGKGNSSNGGAMRIDAKVENGNPFVDDVRVLYSNHYNDPPIAYGKCENGRLLIDLPEIVRDRYLSNKWLDDFKYSFDGIYSDINAGFVAPSIVGYRLNEAIRVFELKSLTSELGDALYIFWDRDLTIKGTNNFFPATVTFDCSFKMGWNLLYRTWSLDQRGNPTNVLYSTQKPSNLTLGWFWDKW